MKREARIFRFVFASSGWSVRGRWLAKRVGGDLFGFRISSIRPIEQWDGQMPDWSHNVLSLARSGRMIFWEAVACAARFKRVLEIPSNPGALGVPSSAFSISAGVIGSRSGFQIVGSTFLAFQEYARLNQGED